MARETRTPPKSTSILDLTVTAVSAAIGYAVVYLAAQLGSESDGWNPLAFLGGWVLLGVAVAFAQGRPWMWLSLSAATIAQLTYVIAVMDHGDGDGLWAVGLFFVVGAAVIGFGVAQSAESWIRKRRSQ